MKFREKICGIKVLKNKLWFSIFLRLTAIFAVFVIILTLANGSLLTIFFAGKQKSILITQIRNLSDVNLSDSFDVSDRLSALSDEYSFDTEIFTENGTVLYTTSGNQMMDYLIIGRDDFIMSHEELIPSKRQIFADGTVFEKAYRMRDAESYMLCRKVISKGIYAEIRVKMELITSSAKIAGEFISIVAVICFLLSVGWVFFYARKFSKPLTLMSETTHRMANLQFDKKLEVKGEDEIADLAKSINTMSDSLDNALSELKASNEKLRDEIELERSLDVMRKAFVANVSHELKTPLAIIKGYAEGLRLNVNSSSRDSYCETIIDEADRMNALVLSILELSRYESGQIPINPTAFDISLLAGESIERIFKNSNINTENKIAENTLVFADKQQIGEVLKAYLENARSHTENEGRVTVSAEEKEDKIRVSVFNTGSHIEAEIMPQIWQSFYRGDTSHKRDETRFGLGLSIVSAIMKMHENNCGVYNTDNGVCFWFEADKAE